MAFIQPPFTTSRHLYIGGHGFCGKYSFAVLPAESAKGHFFLFRRRASSSKPEEVGKRSRFLCFLVAILSSLAVSLFWSLAKSSVTQIGNALSAHITYMVLSIISLPDFDF